MQSILANLAKSDFTMRKLARLNILIGVAVLLSSSALLGQSDVEVLRPFGLEDKVVTVLTSEVREQSGFLVLHRSVFAGTKGDGVFEISTFDSTQNWQSLGMANTTITAMTVQHYGFGPFDGLWLFAGVQPDFQGGDSTLIYQRDVGIPMIDTTWAKADSGIDRNELQLVKALNSYYFTGQTAPQPQLMGGELGLYQGTIDTVWHKAEIDSPVKINAIDVQPHWFGDLAWAAGAHGLSPSAFRSVDKGSTWVTLALPILIEGEAQAVAINTRTPDSVYVSYQGLIFATPDSGQSWQSVLQDQFVDFRALAVDPLAPENVFAGGQKTDSTFVFFHSRDGGTTWSEVVPDTDELIAGVTSIAVVDTGDSDVRTFVFIGTAGDGVWLYRPDLVTGVEHEIPLPDQFTLHQNYPNPFNPTTTIKFDLPKTERVTLKIYNILSQEIRTLVDETMAAGNHQMIWDGKNDKQQMVSSGVYIYHLKAGEFSASHKMVFLQ